MESITEYLLGRIGQELNVNVAKQKIALIGGQIRFLSKYFLSRDEILVHGMEIYSDYLQNEDLIKHIEEKNLSRDILTLQLTEEAVSHFFPENTSTILFKLVKLLLFDAFVGNNDRHFYNWGIIKNITGRVDNYFSPIYDTARGLFWNYSEEKINSYINDSDLNSKLIKYVNNSRPKIGWDGETNINHIKLVKLIYDNEFYCSKIEIKEFFDESNLKKCFKLLNSEFFHLMSTKRRFLIKEYLKVRIEEISKQFT